jgi:hypothetical protein
MCGIQIFNFSEMAVAGYEDHAVLFRGGGNPDVALGEWTSLLL